jgi:hypothetical protein
MKTYLVGYDLNRPEQNYADLIEAIKKYSTWWHHLDSTWIIKTDDSAATVRDSLVAHIDANDELLVVGLTGEGAWRGLNDKGSKWLLDNIHPT